MDKLWDLTTSRDQLYQDTRRMRHELTKTKVQRWSDVFFKLAGTGGSCISLPMESPCIEV